MNDEINRIYSDLPMIIKASLDEMKEHHGDMIEFDYTPEMISEHRKFIDGYVHALFDLQLIHNKDIDKLRSYLTR